MFVGAQIEKRDVELRVDIGFGDAVVPPASRMALTPFLDGDEPATVWAYDAAPVIAEKVETLLSKFPVVLHRLKDLLDIVSLSDVHSFDGSGLTASIKATLERRAATPDPQVLDDMREVAGDRKWQTSWATMLREKAVVDPVELRIAIDKLDRFIRPILVALASGDVPPGTWDPRGPWRS